MNNNETVRETLNRVVRELGAIKDNTNTTPYPSAGYTPYVQTGNPLWAQRQRMTAIQPAQNQPLRPLSNGNNVMNNSYWKENLANAATGFAEGTFAGASRFANGLTGGIYGKIVDSAFDNDYTNRQNLLQERADSVGLGFNNHIMNKTIDVSADLIRAYNLFNKLIKFNK